MNSINLTGNLCKDVEMNNGVAKTTLAVRRTFKDKNTGNYESDFIPLVAFGKTAEFLSNWCQKGNKIAVNGRIQTGSYEAQDGTRRYTTDVIVNEFENLTPKAESGTFNQQSGGNNMPDNDEIPF